MGPRKCESLNPNRQTRIARPELLDLCDVLGLKSFGPLFDLELDELALVQRFVSVHFDSGEVNEYIFT
jgi:hypothetical protein